MAAARFPSRWKTLAVPVFSRGFSAVQKDDPDHPISWPPLSLLSLPPSPTLFLRWPRASSPGAVFPSTIQPFPLKFWAPPRLRCSSVSNKRCRSPVCRCSGEAHSHGRKAPGELAALCIHKTPRNTDRLRHVLPPLFQQVPIRAHLK